MPMPKRSGSWRRVEARSAHRAIVLMGPRRVGKTILAYHAIQALLDEDPTAGRNILYLSLETPLLTGLRLYSLVDRLHCARWKSGELDLVSLDPARQRPQFAVEVLNGLVTVSCA